MRILGLRGTIINLYGPSGIGKTGIIELVASIYQSPDNIITFAATPISITILAERLSGIGLILEEKQSSFDDSKISTLLYSLAEGRTRLKATVESDVIENRKFELNVLTTAEEPLNENSHTGASRRTIELYVNKIFSSDEMSRKAHRVSRENYGLALSEFVNYLIDDYSDENYRMIKEKYNEIEKKLYENMKEDIVISYVQSVAVIVLADILMNKVFGFGFNERDSIELGNSILEKLNSEKEIDEVERAKEIIEDFLLMNDDKFERQSFTCEYQSVNDINKVREVLDSGKNVYEHFGMYQDGIYYILPTKFNEIIRKNELSPNKIRRGFAERGYISIDEINNRFSVVKFYKGGNRRMIAYKLENEPKVEKNEVEGEMEESVISKNMYNGAYDELFTESKINEFEESFLNLRDRKENKDEL